MGRDGSNPFVGPSRGLKPTRGDFFIPLGALQEAGGAGRGGEVVVARRGAWGPFRVKRRHGMERGSAGERGQHEGRGLKPQEGECGGGGGGLGSGIRGERTLGCSAGVWPPQNPQPQPSFFFFSSLSLQDDPNAPHKLQDSLKPCLKDEEPPSVPSTAPPEGGKGGEPGGCGVPCLHNNLA
ncbi:Chondroitin sulfate proteoglycan 5 [Aix galericulata]|nr:Chondroitin sulfate proteoglycan 5 [Aix galericulata]